MMKILKSPGKYIQGCDLLEHFGDYTQGIGDHFLVILSENGLKRTGAVLEKSVQDTKITLDFQVFSGECAKAKILMYAQRCKENGITAVVGIGGGKILDTAKGVAHGGAGTADYRPGYRDADPETR